MRVNVFNRKGHFKAASWRKVASPIQPFSAAAGLLQCDAGLNKKPDRQSSVQPQLTRVPHKHTKGLAHIIS